MQETVLTIAGSDPTGGAGLQADIKTMTSIGVYAAAVVTCVTVQNSWGVKRVFPLPPDLVKEQIQGVLEDHHVTHIKIGMVGNAAIADAICHAVDDFAGEIIVDPVILSSTGQELLPSSDLATIRAGLLARATIITPNLPELTVITGIETEKPELVLQAGDMMLENFSGLRAALIKGGHGADEDEVTDILLFRSAGSIKLISSTRTLIDTTNTHGTGCTLASAYAAYHCLTGDDELAFFKSTAFMQHVLDQSSNVKIVKNPAGRGGLLYSPLETGEPFFPHLDQEEMEK